MVYYLVMLLSQTAFAVCTSAVFDYVIVGGGTAGLVIANRLSSRPNVTVAVIEAGSAVHNNPNVTTIPKSPAEYGRWLGTSLEWNYTTTPQKHGANRTLPYYAGKGIGGSTLINGRTYLRAEKAQIDAWEELGNEHWNWDSMWPHYLAQETFYTPAAIQVQNGAMYVDAAHGRRGEVDVAFQPYLTGQGLFDIVNKTSEALGYSFNKDPNRGYMSGTSAWPSMLDPKTMILEDSARAFYWPVANVRSNLHLFLNSTATRIIWDETSYGSEVVASAVEIVAAGRSARKVYAAKEVIVAAGSIRSPSFLEHSGIGNNAVIESLGIKPVASVPSLGSNLQDQPANGFSYTSSTNWTGYPTFVTYLTASDLFGANLTTISRELKANVSAYAAAILKDYAPNSNTLEAQERLLRHQIDLIFTPTSKVPLAEILWFAVQTNLLAQFWNLLPLSRGSVHITSPNTTNPPSIDPNFFQLPIDLYVQSAIAIRVREFFATAPFSQHVTQEVSPGFDTVPQSADWTDPAWHTWIKQTHSSNSHPVTTCAMMSKGLGGVVNEKGKIYGTKNVRVVDASVFPTQISGHLTASVYVIAERIAAAIQGKR